MCLQGKHTTFNNFNNNNNGNFTSLHHERDQR